LGRTPTIDGVFGEGEWDDAPVVTVGNDRFRIKHDGTHLYFAFQQDGGSLYVAKEKGIRVLHASAQLGSAEYTTSGGARQSLAMAFDWQLYGLQNESVTDIQEKLSDYLARNGWVASTGPLGNFGQSEWAVSLAWLGLTDTSSRYLATPRMYIFAARMRLSPEEKEAFQALSPEQRKNRYPPLYWPAPPVPDEALNNGQCPATLTIDPTGWGKIWLDRKMPDQH
jgi:hypothetical protein